MTSQKVKGLREGKRRSRWPGVAVGGTSSGAGRTESLLSTVNDSGPQPPPGGPKRKGGPQSSVIWPLDPGDKEPDFNSRKGRDHGLPFSFRMHDHFSVPANPPGSSHDHF